VARTAPTQRRMPPSKAAFDAPHHPSRWGGACSPAIYGGAPARSFSLPPSFPSLHLEKRLAIAKQSLAICLLS